MRYAGQFERYEDNHYYHSHAALLFQCSSVCYYFCRICAYENCTLSTISFPIRFCITLTHIPSGDVQNPYSGALEAAYTGGMAAISMVREWYD